MRARSNGAMFAVVFTGLAATGSTYAADRTGGLRQAFRGGWRSISTCAQELAARLRTKEMANGTVWIRTGLGVEGHGALFKSVSDLGGNENLIRAKLRVPEQHSGSPATSYVLLGRDGKRIGKSYYGIKPVRGTSLIIGKVKTPTLTLTGFDRTYHRWQILDPSTGLPVGNDTYQKFRVDKGHIIATSLTWNGSGAKNSRTEYVINPKTLTRFAGSVGFERIYTRRGELRGVARDGTVSRLRVEDGQLKITAIGSDPSRTM